MANLNITITAPTAALTKYADDLGYNPTVLVGDPGSEVEQPNPETKAQFLARQVEDIVASALAARSSQTIRKTKDTEYRTESATILNQIKAATSVTITA